MDYKKKVYPNGVDEGWTLYNKMKDYTRMVRFIFAGEDEFLRKFYV